MSISSREFNYLTYGDEEDNFFADEDFVNGGQGDFDYDSDSSICVLNDLFDANDPASYIYHYFGEFGTWKELNKSYYHTTDYYIKKYKKPSQIKVVYNNIGEMSINSKKFSPELRQQMVQGWLDMHDFHPRQKTKSQKPRQKTKSQKPRQKRKPQKAKHDSDDDSDSDSEDDSDCSAHFHKCPERPHIVTRYCRKPHTKTHDHCAVFGFKRTSRGDMKKFEPSPILISNAWTPPVSKPVPTTSAPTAHLALQPAHSSTQSKVCPSTQQAPSTSEAVSSSTAMTTPSPPFPEIEEILRVGALLEQCNGNPITILMTISKNAEFFRAFDAACVIFRSCNANGRQALQ